MKEPIFYVKIIVNLVIFALVCLFFVLFFPRILVFFMPFVIGLIIAAIANPLVRFLEKRVKIVRKHSSAIIIIVVIALIIGLGYLLISILVREFMNLANDWEGLLLNFTTQMNEFFDKLNSITKSLPVNVDNIVEKLSGGITNYVANLSENIKLPSLASASSIVTNIADAFVMVIFTILSAYFLIAKRDELVTVLKKVIPESIRNGYNIVIANFKSALGGYFKAQFKIMCVILLIIFIGFEILGIGYSFLLALAIAFLDLLPFFGTGAVLWPWAIISFIMGDYAQGIIMLVIYLICQVVKQLLQPKLVGDSIGISPFSTLIFMFIGYRLGGVIGLIFGIPIGMVLISFYRNGMFDGIIYGIKVVFHDINNFRKLK